MCCSLTLPPTSPLLRVRCPRQETLIWKTLSLHCPTQWLPNADLWTKSSRIPSEVRYTRTIQRRFCNTKCIPRLTRKSCPRYFLFPNILLWNLVKVDGGSLCCFFILFYLAKQKVGKLRAHRNTFWDLPSLQATRVWESPGKGASRAHELKLRVSWIPAPCWAHASHFLPPLQLHCGEGDSILLGWFRKVRLLVG